MNVKKEERLNNEINYEIILSREDLYDKNNYEMGVQDVEEFMKLKNLLEFTKYSNEIIIRTEAGILGRFKLGDPKQVSKIDQICG